MSTNFNQLASATVRVGFNNQPDVVPTYKFAINLDPLNLFSFIGGTSYCLSSALEKFLSPYFSGLALQL